MALPLTHPTWRLCVSGWKICLTCIQTMVINHFFFGVCKAMGLNLVTLAGPKHLGRHLINPSAHSGGVARSSKQIAATWSIKGW